MDVPLRDDGAAWGRFGDLPPQARGPANARSPTRRPCLPHPRDARGSTWCLGASQGFLQVATAFLVHQAPDARRNPMHSYLVDGVGVRMDASNFLVKAMDGQVVLGHDEGQNFLGSRQVRAALARRWDEASRWCPSARYKASVRFHASLRARPCGLVASTRQIWCLTPSAVMKSV